jgi:hypothetical protein
MRISRSPAARRQLPRVRAPAALTRLRRRQLHPRLLLLRRRRLGWNVRTPRERLSVCRACVHAEVLTAVVVVVALPRSRRDEPRVARQCVRLERHGVI